MPEPSVSTRRGQVATNGQPTPTAADLRHDLSIAEARLKEHIAGLRSELTLADIRIGDMPLVSHIRHRPLAVTAITLGTFALGTFLLTIARRRRPDADTWEQWWDLYYEDLLDDAALRIGRDGDVDSALQKALRQRAPVIVIEHETASEGPFRTKAFISAAASVLNTALGFGMKVAMNRLTQDLEDHARKTEHRQGSHEY
jgi:hypothetical protein